MKTSATVYTNKKGATMMMLRIPIDDAAALAVGRQEVLEDLQVAIERALNNRRGEGASDLDA